MTTEMTLYRCYWPSAHDYLKVFGVTFSAKAYGLLMTLNIPQEHAYAVASLLPVGSVIDIVPIETQVLQILDDLPVAYRRDMPSALDKN